MASNKWYTKTLLEHTVDQGINKVILKHKGSDLSATMPIPSVKYRALGFSMWCHSSVLGL